MADKPKGAGQWISHGGTGNDPEQSARLDEALKELDQPRPRGDREKKAINRNAAFVRSMLKNHASAVINTTGGRALHEDDEAELAASLADEAKALPARFRDRVKEAAKSMRDSISEGDRASAWRLADETAARIGAELPPTFSPPEDDPAELEAIIANIPR